MNGFHEDLNQAVRHVSIDMLALPTDYQGPSRNDAYSLMSVAGDLGITQVVDPRQGAHIRLPRRAFRSSADAPRGTFRPMKVPKGGSVG